MSYEPGASYSPSSEELKLRKELTWLMAEREWNDSVRDAIMHDDNPSVETALRLIQECGIDKAYEILKGFI